MTTTENGVVDNRCALWALNVCASVLANLEQSPRLRQIGCNLQQLEQGPNPVTQTELLDATVELPKILAFPENQLEVDVVLAVLALVDNLHLETFDKAWCHRITTLLNSSGEQQSKDLMSRSLLRLIVELVESGQTLEEAQETVRLLQDTN